MWYWVAVWIPNMQATGFRDMGDTLSSGMTLIVSSTQVGPAQQTWLMYICVLF